jgi:putative inorganic carbon (hco3(-)) transporter
MGKELYIKRFSFRQFLRYHFIEKKLNTFYGHLFLFLVVIGFTFGIVTIDLKIGLVVLSIFSGFLLLIVTMKWTYFGFYFLIVFSSLVVIIDRVINTPVPSGLLAEAFGYICLLSILLKNDLKKNINRRFYTNPITIGMYVLFAYYVVELFNTEMIGKFGWLSYFRKQFSFFVFYYICYCMLDSKEKIIYFVRFMIGLSTVLALYACKQQWFGYANFELQAIGKGYILLFQGGLLRKFSVFSDPATSGILFASITMLCIILIFRGTNKKERSWLGVALVINLLGYSYSGTRTATLMIIAGILLYCLSAIYERRTIIFLIYSALVYIILMFMPYQNPITNRIRSTFEGTKDASAAVRDYDRHEVQPYIQAHPMGGGIFTVGGEGSKYNSGHYLENLQADSGYMKVIAEEGPIGLALLLSFYFIVMRIGYRSFYRVKDPEIRTYYIALLIMMFTLVVAQYAQMTLSQYPVVHYFYGTMVIFIKLVDFDKPVRLIKTTQI